jgi:uncharacterized membrane protein SpoIIM required for sporulation
MSQAETASTTIGGIDTSVMSNAILRSDRFRVEREAEWQRLDTIITHIEKGRTRRISDEDAMALPTLYRKTVSALSIARESSLDDGLVTYLESLTLRAYYQVYGTRTSLGRWLSEFIGGGWSRAIRAIQLEIWIMVAIMIAGSVVGYVLVDQNSDWYFALVPGEMSGGRVPGADPAILKETLGGVEEGSEDGLSVFAASLFSNNAGVGIFAFALGFAFGIPTILLEIYNFTLLGAMTWVFVDADLGVEFIAWLSIHGTTELLAILLAGAAGLHIGRSMAFPGQLTHMAALQKAGTQGALVMTGVVVMLIMAAVLEGFGRQLITGTVARYAIGYGLLLFWIVYFVFAGRGKGSAQDNGNSDGA